MFWGVKVSDMPTCSWCCHLVAGCVDSFGRLGRFGVISWSFLSCLCWSNYTVENFQYWSWMICWLKCTKPLYEMPNYHNFWNHPFFHPAFWVYSSRWTGHSSYRLFSVSRQVNNHLTHGEGIAEEGQRQGGDVATEISGVFCRLCTHQMRGIKAFSLQTGYGSCFSTVYMYIYIYK